MTPCFTNLDDKLGFADPDFEMRITGVQCGDAVDGQLWIHLALGDSSKKIIFNEFESFRVSDEATPIYQRLCLKPKVGAFFEVEGGAYLTEVAQQPLVQLRRLRGEPPLMHLIVTDPNTIVEVICSELPTIVAG